MAKSNTRITADKDEVAIYTYEYTATSGQTTFSGSDDNSATLDYTAGSITVSYGGLELPESDYTATNGTSVVLADGAVAGEIIRVVAYEPFVVSDALPITGGTLTGGLNVSSGNVGIGTSSPNHKLDVEGQGSFKKTYAWASGNYHIKLESTYGNGISSYIGNVSSSDRMNISAGGYYYGASLYQLTDGATGMGTINIGEDGTLTYQSASGATANSTVDPVERMRIDSSGRVTTPNQPAFIAYDPSGGARSSTGLFSDEFTSTLRNNGGHYNTSTGYFTAPVAGYYLFGWNLFSTVSGTTTSRSGIWHNGSTNGYGFSGGSTVAGASQGSVLMYLNANDTAALGTQGSSYTTYWYANQQHSRFWGYLVG